MVSGEKPPWGSSWSLHIDVLDYLLRVRRTEEIDDTSSRHLNYNAHLMLVSVEYQDFPDVKF